jgi:hypothetical protein
LKQEASDKSAAAPARQEERYVDMQKAPKALSRIFNSALAAAFFASVFLPFWLISIPAKYSAWRLAFSYRYLYIAYKLPTTLRLWKILPLPQTKDAKWLLAFAFYAAFSVLFAAFLTAAVAWRRKTTR